MKDQKNTQLYGVRLKPRIIVRPKASVSVDTPKAKAEVMRSVQRVMAEHRDVLAALKDR